MTKFKTYRADEIMEHLDEILAPREISEEEITAAQAQMRELGSPFAVGVAIAQAEYIKEGGRSSDADRVEELAGFLEQLGHPEAAAILHRRAKELREVRP